MGRLSPRVLHEIWYSSTIGEDALKPLWKHRQTELLLFAAALLAYLPGITWGLPVATGADRVFVWAYDDLSPLPALTETYHTFIHDSPDHWVAYPLLHYLTLAIAYSPYLLWMLLTGHWKSPSAVYPFGFTDPVGALQTLTVIARVVSAGMAAGVVVIAYRAASLLWDRRTGLLSAAIVFAPYPMFYYTKTANLEIPYLFWGSLGLLAFIGMLVRGPSARGAGWTGAFAGLAAAAKDQAAGLFLLMPLFFAPWNRKDWPRIRPVWWSLGLAFVLAGAVTYALGSGLALGPHRYLDHLHFLFVGDKSNAPFNDPYPATLAGTLTLLARIPAALAWWFGPMLALACVFGMVKERARILVGMLLPVAGYTALFLLPLHYFKARHTLPIGFVLALFAAHGLGSALKTWGPKGTAAVLALALAWPLVLSGDLVFQLNHDSRIEAGQWLAASMPTGSRIADCGGPRKMPHLREDVRIVQLHDGAAAFDDLNQQRPEFVEVTPDWTGRAGREFSRTCPQALYDGLADGSLGYELAGRFKTHSLVERQMMDYPTVNPQVFIYRRKDLAAR